MRQKNWKGYTFISTWVVRWIQQRVSNTRSRVICRFAGKGEGCGRRAWKPWGHQTALVGSAEHSDWAWGWRDTTEWQFQDTGNGMKVKRTRKLHPFWASVLSARLSATVCSGPYHPGFALFIAVRWERITPVALSWLSGDDWGTSCHLWSSMRTG